MDLQRGERSRAKSKYEESAEIFRVIGNNTFLAYPLRRLGYLALEQNDIQTARDYFLESLKFNHETGDMPGLTASLVSMSAWLMRINKPILAARIYGVVENRLESLSVNLLHTDQVEYGKIRSELSSLLDEATFEAAFTEGWEMGEEKAVEFIGKIFVGLDKQESQAEPV